jgi:hypothetical protein
MQIKAEDIYHWQIYKLEILKETIQAKEKLYQIEFKMKNRM